MGSDLLISRVWAEKLGFNIEMTILRRERELLLRSLSGVDTETDIPFFVVEKPSFDTDINISVERNLALTQKSKVLYRTRVFKQRP